MLGRILFIGLLLAILTWALWGAVWWYIGGDYLAAGMRANAYFADNLLALVDQLFGAKGRIRSLASVFDLGKTMFFLECEAGLYALFHFLYSLIRR